MKTIEQICNAAPGSFKKFLKQKASAERAEELRIKLAIKMARKK